MIKVLIVDDSATARLALRLALERETELMVIGEAEDGAQALQLVKRLQPDLVTMDVYLRSENGIDVVEQLMASHPRPILIVTGADLNHNDLSYDAITAGALEVASKLPALDHPDYESKRKSLVRLVKTLSTVPVVHHFHSRRKKRQQLPSRPTTAPKARAVKSGQRVLCLGASTGGPPVVSTLLQKLPAPYRYPIVFCQHISQGFIGSFATWLSQCTGHDVVIVENTHTLTAGSVYLQRDNYHLVFTGPYEIASVDEVEGARIRPSIDAMFYSAAEHLGSLVTGVLFTGMGSDGARGLAALRQAGASTIAQDPTTCAIDSMPRAAIDLGAARHVLAPDAMADLILRER